MIAILRIEAIGDDVHMRDGKLVASGRTIPGHLRSVARYLVADKPWVARITGPCPKYGLQREFLRHPKKDWRDSNSTGSRGVYLHYELRPGVYEVNERVSWKRNRRYFVRSIEGRVEEIGESDVLQEVSRAD